MRAASFREAEVGGVLVLLQHPHVPQDIFPLDFFQGLFDPACKQTEIPAIGFPGVVGQPQFHCQIFQKQIDFFFQFIP